ncbi:MAG: polar amino acid ABC transporter permease [Planctomycetota bacterium]|nr:MAG: polar amino acid ABC transporter permease [Planctomycetota bacterium]
MRFLAMHDMGGGASAPRLVTAGVVALALTCASEVRADALDGIRARGELVWGADQEGGGPFVYPDPADPSRLRGFEVELADLLAAELGVKARFFQADWTTLPEFLDNGTIDVVLNGYEWTPGRAERMRATRPYYIYELQLMAREDETRFATVEALCHPPDGRTYTVGVLGGSGAAVWLQENCPGAVELFEYDGNTNAMMQVQAGVHDATLQDLPIAIFYRGEPQARGLKFVGLPVGRGYYVMYVRREEERLAETINAALSKALTDGRLRTIYLRYGLWNATQEELAHAGAQLAVSKGERSWSAVARYGPVLLKAAGMTVLLSVAAMPLAMLIGLLVALGRLYGPAILKAPLTLYVEVLRGTPVMLQLYVLYFLLPKLLGVGLGPVVAAIAGLAVNYSAYEAEIYRAGLQAIPKGQMEAALALGMTRRTALRRVVIPQAVRIVIPPVTNDFIALFKDTSICSVIAVVELTKQYNMLANNTTAVLELAGMTALLYLAMSYPLSIVARRTEKALAGDVRPVGA